MSGSPWLSNDELGSVFWGSSRAGKTKSAMRRWCGETGAECSDLRRARDDSSGAGMDRVRELLPEALELKAPGGI